MYFNAFGVRIWVNNMAATKILDTTAYSTFSFSYNPSTIYQCLIVFFIYLLQICFLKK